MEASSQFNSKGRDPYCLGNNCLVHVMLAGTVRMGLDNPRDLPQVRGVAAGGCLGLCLQQGIQSVAQDCRRMSAEGTSLSRPSVGAGTVLPIVCVSGQPRRKDKREKLSTMPWEELLVVENHHCYLKQCLAPRSPFINSSYHHSYAE